MRSVFILLATLGMSWGYTTGSEGDRTVFFTNGTPADIESACTDALDNYIVDIPSGTVDWSDRDLDVSGKYITVRGQGGGGIVAHSRDAVAFGTGSKTFNVYENGWQFRDQPTVTVGETLAVRLAHDGQAAFMEGTVSSYTYPEVIMNITNSVPSTYTTEDNWILERPALTTIVMTFDPGGNQNIWDFENGENGLVILEGMRFVGPLVNDASILIAFDAFTGHAGFPSIVRNCSFEVRGHARCLKYTSNKGVVHNCSFDGGFTAPGKVSSHQGVWIYSSQADSWTTPSTMGDDDPNGSSNVYIEECTTHGFSQTFADNDSNGKIVFRRNTWIESSMIGGHSQDSGIGGGHRHSEAYQNAMLFKNDGPGQTFNVPDYFSWRGGTGVVWGNYIEDINSPSYSDKSEITLQVQNIGRNAGPYACWGNDNTPADTIFPAPPDTAITRNPDGEGWPVPRQPGMGYTDGLFGFVGGGGYSGDPEPIWVWGNTGFTPVAGSSVGGFSSCGADQDSASAYVHIDLDDNEMIDDPVTLVMRSASAKPGYAAYTYPHPLTGAGSAPETDPPTPDPMTFAVAPAAAGPSSVIMTATTASDATLPVQYQVRRDGVTETAWQGSPSFTVSGLTPATSYDFEVRARDSASTPNVTAYSSISSATTNAAGTGPPATATTVTAATITIGN